MEEIILTIVLQGLEKALVSAAEYAVKYIIKKVIDETGRAVTQIIYEYDSDGDGENDCEEVLYTLELQIPDLNNGYCLCNDGDDIGIGLPQYVLLDGLDVVNYIDSSDLFNPPVVTGNNDGIILDLDGDGDLDDVLVPFGFDLTGDGLNDFGWIVDYDDNGIPDASPDAPFYPVGSREYHDIVEKSVGIPDPSIIVVSGDGTLTVYDMNGDITSEDCDTAYSLWVSEHGALDKPFDYYTVSEALLFLIFLGSFATLLFKVFKRRKF